MAILSSGYCTRHDNGTNMFCVGILIFVALMIASRKPASAVFSLTLQSCPDWQHTLCIPMRITTCSSIHARIFLLQEAHPITPWTYQVHTFPLPGLCSSFVIQSFPAMATTLVISRSGNASCVIGFSKTRRTCLPHLPVPGSSP